jgi:hypothetical protein
MNIEGNVYFCRTGIMARDDYLFTVNFKVPFGCLIHQSTGGTDLHTGTTVPTTGTNQ